MSFIIEWDQKIFDWVNAGFPRDGMDRVASFFSASSTWWALAFVILIAGFVLKKSIWVKGLLVGALALGASDILCSYLLKPTFQRMRPCHERQVKLRAPSCGSPFGMPSNHASNGAAFLAASSFFFIGWGRILLVAGVLWVGWSRIYLGVHFPLDILAGYLVGGSVGALIGFSIVKTPSYIKKPTKNNVPQ